MIIPSRDLEWVDSIFQNIRGYQAYKLFHRRYSEKLDILFHIEEYASINEIRGVAVSRFQSDHPRSSTPEGYRSIEMDVGRELDYAFCWSVFLHELGHLECRHPQIRSKLLNCNRDVRRFGASLVFRHEVEAWNFAANHWAQVPTSEPFPQDEMNRALERYHDWKKEIDNVS